MKIMVGVAHPKHVHFRKNIINNLMSMGHEVKVVARKKDLTLHLLNSYSIEHEVIGQHYKQQWKKIYGVLETDYFCYKVAKKFKPDLIVGGSPYLAHIGKILGVPHISFSDTENTPFNNFILYSCSELVCTPSSFKNSLDSKKHIRYEGFEELAYLHPDYFKPDDSILSQIGIDKSEKYIVVRFVEWDATHDKGSKGFIDKSSFIRELEKYGRVFITSEKKLPNDLESNRIRVPPEKIHDLLYYANLFIGESSSMACESAILGTPSLYVSTSRRGYIDELESSYGLVHNFSNPTTGQADAFQKALELMEDSKSKFKWQKKREKMLTEKIDVTKFVTELISEYPESVQSLKNRSGVSYGE